MPSRSEGGARATSKREADECAPTGGGIAKHDDHMQRVREGTALGDERRGALGDERRGIWASWDGSHRCANVLCGAPVPVPRRAGCVGPAAPAWACQCGAQHATIACTWVAIAPTQVLYEEAEGVREEHLETKKNPYRMFYQGVHKAHKPLLSLRDLLIVTRPPVAATGVLLGHSRRRIALLVGISLLLHALQLLQ